MSPCCNSNSQFPNIKADRNLSGNDKIFVTGEFSTPFAQPALPDILY